MANLIQISSVPAESVNSNSQQIVASWKDTDKRPISPANRKRAILLPQTIWQSDESIPRGDSEVSKMLRVHVLDSIAELAKNYLAAVVEESNWQRTEIPLEHFTLSALLAWQAEQAAISGRLNGDEIRKWLAESVTIRTVKEKHGEKIAGALGEQFVKLASPNHGLTPEKASKLLSGLWQNEDCDSTTGLRVQMRLTAISKKNENSENLLDSIL